VDASPWEASEASEASPSASSILHPASCILNPLSPFSIPQPPHHRIRSIVGLFAVGVANSPDERAATEGGGVGVAGAIGRVLQQEVKV